MDQKDLLQMIGDDTTITPLNDTAELLGRLALIIEFIEDDMEVDHNSLFHRNEHKTKKLMRHLIKAGKALIEMEEPVFTATLEVRLSALGESKDG